MFSAKIQPSAAVEKLWKISQIVVIASFTTGFKGEYGSPCRFGRL
jgi:hypothetical protein